MIDLSRHQTSRILSGLVGLVLAAHGQVNSLKRELQDVSISLTRSRASGICSGQFNRDATGIDYRGIQLARLIQLVYGIELVAGTGPDSLYKQPYDISAKISPDVSPEQLRAKLQNLLQERFGLVVSEVTKERKEYSLVVSKEGQKIYPIAKKPDKLVDQPWAFVTGLPAGTRVFGRYTMDQLAAGLAGAVRGPVANNTGLQGLFQIEVDYLPEQGEPTPQICGSVRGWPFGRSVASFLPPSTETYPSIFDAVKVQLGLELQARVVSVNLLRIDHVEKVPLK